MPIRVYGLPYEDYVGWWKRVGFSKLGKFKKSDDVIL
jgi:uncharacterized membrane protein